MRAGEGLSKEVLIFLAHGKKSFEVFLHLSIKFFLILKGQEGRKEVLFALGLDQLPDPFFKEVGVWRGRGAGLVLIFQDTVNHQEVLVIGSKEVFGVLSEEEELS